MMLTRDALWRQLVVPLLFASTAVLGGCASAGQPSTFDAATSRPEGGLTFPQHRLNPESAAWQAALMASVRVQGACVYLVDETGDSYLAVWPPEYRVVSQQPVAIDVGDGQLIRNSTKGTFGGGELNLPDQAEMLRSLLDGDPPSSCATSTYWIVTNYTPE